MLANMASSKYVYTDKHIATVKAKTADDLAESLEIMMIETRPIGSNRTALRGAICILRDEVTVVLKSDAIEIVRNLKKLWLVQKLEARVLICQRAIEMIEEKDAK